MRGPSRASPHRSPSGSRNERPAMTLTLDTVSVPLVVHYVDPSDDLVEPRERVHHEPMTFDRLVTGEGFPPALLNPRQGPRHAARPTLRERLRARRASR
ncbi:hypothetical protein SEA_HONK_65 [Microbacterium phage Honk]|uniref:Uncharacterized protein n=1 Tax=Microbacterium phage Honk TaxID=2836095 RepID=A0A8F3E5W9_9CAUD|nr:hypothetical protein SEA_HONK_65 [Microbacterium phage Honk]